jgi:preprotein translocase subunit YajC
MISLAYAQSAAPSAASGTAMIQQFLLPVILVIVFWFMLIRPQMQRAKEQKRMLAELAKGDEVVTASGQVGKIVKIGEQYVSLEIADGVTTHVQKQAIQTLLPKGTIKGL